MIVLSNLFVAGGQLVHGLFQLAWWVLMARIVLSWLRPQPSNDLLRSLVVGVYRLTDPVLDRVRRALPFLVVSGLDLTPIAVFFAMGFADRFLTSTLIQVGQQLA
ncbi:MAG: YggT family protein [Alphaproteobacteria bacterium]|nr:YggT family protein [Alphaproteobacteria bacterium]MCB9696412.1 YggT family protein [Alphaproteobacteria bacterium]